MRQLLDTKCDATVAYGKRGAIVGWAASNIAGDRIYINVFVHRSHRHKGIGKKLIIAQSNLYTDKGKVIVFKRNNGQCWMACPVTTLLKQWA